MNGKSAVGLHVPCCQPVPNLSTSSLHNTVSVSLRSSLSAIGPPAQPEQVGDLGTADPESKLIGARGSQQDSSDRPAQSIINVRLYDWVLHKAKSEKNSTAVIYLLHI